MFSAETGAGANGGLLVETAGGDVAVSAPGVFAVTAALAVVGDASPCPAGLDVAAGACADGLARLDAATGAPLPAVEGGETVAATLGGLAGGSVPPAGPDAPAV